MNILATLSVTDLSQILKLRQEAETLQARLAEINATLAAFAEGKTPVPVQTAVASAATAASEAEPAQPKQRKMSAAVRAKMFAARKAWWAQRKGIRMVESAAKAGAAKGPERGKHGAVKEAIIELVKNAGSEGITVKEMAARLGGNPRRIYVWFSNTGKKIKEIKKAGPGKYAWATASTPVAKPAAAAKPEKAKGAGRVVSTGVIASDPGQPPDIRDQEESQAKTGIARCRFCGSRAIPGLDVCFSCDDSR